MKHINIGSLITLSHVNQRDLFQNLENDVLQNVGHTVTFSPHEECTLPMAVMDSSYLTSKLLRAHVASPISREKALLTESRDAVSVT